MSKDDIADYFDLGGERKERTISRYENNSRVPNNERLKELAKLYNVNIMLFIVFLFKFVSSKF